MNKETIIIFKDKKSREIKTFVNLDGHGVEISIEDFLSLVCETYGGVASTIKRETHLQRMIEASVIVVLELKSKTKEVAAINMEPIV